MALDDRCIFISHSSHDDTWATDCRHVIIDEIGKMAGYQALVDERLFAAGDLWRPTLYQWLGIADAAVLLLSPQALASPWVRKEATILMWRRDLGSGVTIIPVLLGVHMSDVIAQWPAMEIDESHAVTVPAGAKPAEIARSVLTRFGNIGDSGDAIRGWIARVASLLELCDRIFLRLGAMELELQDHDVRADGLSISMSHALLHSDILRAEQALRQTADGLGPRLGSLVGLVTPLSIPLDVAEPVSRAMARKPGRRIAVVPASFPETGPLVADRATCSDRRVIKVDALCAGAENSAELIFDEVVKNLSARVGAPPGVRVTATDIEKIGSIILTIRYSPDDGVTEEVLRSVVAQVVKDFPVITVVILTGSNTAEAAARLNVSDAVIAPPLTSDEEWIGLLATNRLLALTKER